MTGKRSLMILTAVAFTLVLTFAGQPAQADWSVSFQGEIGSSYSGDRITTEYRRGYQVDDWVERGASSVTESPLFSDGIRLTSWATGYDDDYEYGVASGIYFFEIPPRARSVRIKISYDGEADRSDFDDAIAGRVWIRRATIGDDYEEYYPREGRYEDADEPLYGDTFVLRATKSIEILRLSTDDYVDDGMMELHIVAEGRQRIDVKYIEVETYSYEPRVRVITRYYRDYSWQPWNHYAYWYFYTGPVYHFGDYYYVRYTYPRYRYNYVEIRKRFNSYLTVYYVSHPHHHHVRWVHVGRVPRDTRRTWDRGRLNRWTPDYEEARKSYVVTSTKQRGSVDVQKSRTRIRSVLSSGSHQSPSTTRALSGNAVRTSIRRDKTSTQARDSNTSDVNRSTNPDIRRGTDRTRSSTTAPTRVETQSSAKSRRVETQTSVRTRTSTTPDRRESEREVKRQTTRTAPQEQRKTTPDTEQAKTRRESVRPRQAETKKAEPQKEAPARKVETKKEDEDDDEDDEKSSSVKTRSTSSTSSTSSSSSSTKTRKTR